jgi:hypothetical protein
MKSTPFDEKTDYPPIPFQEKLCEIALRMKESGLEWRPHAGCFVWDPEKIIPAPSPFPNRVYFILNLNHFLKIFGSIKSMQEKLVWLPTWHQARLLIGERKIQQTTLKESLLKSEHWSSINEINILYQIVLDDLQKKMQRNINHD